MKCNYKTFLKTLCKFAYSEGFIDIDLLYSGVSSIYWHSRNLPNRIVIEGKYSNEFKVYLMLHELGHHVLRRDWDLFGLSLPIVHQAESSNELKYRRRQTYIVASLEEEFKAWDEGLKLGISYGICIDRDKWDKLRAKCLMSYIKHYSILKI